MPFGFLSERSTPREPFSQFDKWYKKALSSRLIEPTAMTLATATKDGVPSARMVLLKSYDDRGFVFFTNYRSRKGAEISENPRATLLFWWDKLERQIRIEGTLSRIAPEESDAYFASRPLGSRIGAWASMQSQPIPNRRYLVKKAVEFARRYGRNVPRPPHWGGYRLEPSRIEFWQGRQSRLHDRILYTRAESGGWNVERLSP